MLLARSIRHSKAILKTSASLAAEVDGSVFKILSV
jgi:hypothetical protein